MKTFKSNWFGLLIVTAVALAASAFTINSYWHSESTDTLVNEKYQQTLTLYSNGYAAVETTDGAGAGKYDINYNDEITINWENGHTSTGFVTRVVTVGGKRRVRSAVIQGVTYTNTERFVVPRGRR